MVKPNNKKRRPKKARQRLNGEHGGALAEKASLSKIVTDTQPNGALAQSQTTKKKRRKRKHPSSNDAPSSSNVELSVEIPSPATLPLRKVSRQRSSFQKPDLPILAVSAQLMAALLEHDSLVLLAETGCGKSTQLPQLALEAGFGSTGSDRIAVTQPRRVAAIALASRVAQERDENVGECVGYKVRFEAAVSDETRLLYVTDGMLLAEAIHDPMLSSYSMIVIDEAHERSVHTDVLLLVVRRAQMKRRELPRSKHLSVVVMSATLDSQLFSDYFDVAPVFVVRGRTHPVEIFHAETLDPSSDDHLHQAIVATLQIHQSEPLTDDILVFLTGREEIETAVRKMNEVNELLGDRRIHAIPLYAALSHQQQMRVFDRPPARHRKVVFATNIAETSLTLSGVRCVIDSGKAKLRVYTAESQHDILAILPISRASAAQRAGRAGREAPGKCYRLYSSSYMESTMPASTEPEIRRTNLSEVLLSLYAMWVRRRSTLSSLIEPPTTEQLDAAHLELKMLGLVKEIEKKGKVLSHLTDDGRKASKLPVQPIFARALLIASQHGCLEEAIGIVACLSTESVWLEGSSAAELGRRRLGAASGDHATMLAAFRAYTQMANKKGDIESWSAEHGVNSRALATARNVARQLRKELVHQLGLKSSSCGGENEKLRRWLSSSLLPNICIRNERTGGYRWQLQPSVELRIHPTSVLSRSQPHAIVFSDLVQTSHIFAKNVTVIDEDWVRAEFEHLKRMSFGS